METFLEAYNGDFNPFVISSELALLPTICKDFVPINFEDIVKTLPSVSQHQRNLISNSFAVMRIVLTNDATSATPESPF